MKSNNYLKSVLMYVCTFLVVVAVTAGLKVGWFFINKTPNGDGEQVLATPLTKVVNNVLSTEKMNLDMDLQLSSQTNAPLKISANIFLNMPTASEEISQSLLSNTEDTVTQEDNVLKVSLNGFVEYDNQIVPYEISYLNGHIYAILGEAQFKIETENLMSDLNTILNFALLKKFGVNISLPDLSQFSFSPELLSSIAGQLEENDVEDKKEIKFNLMGYGWVTMVTDKDYNLENIILSELDLNGTKISADVKADFSPIQQEIVEPENTDDMTDLSGLTKFLQVVDTLGQKGNISGNATLNIMNKTLSSDYCINFEDFGNIKIYLKTKFINQDFVFIFKDHNAYISYLDCKYKFTAPFDFSEIKQAIEFYAQKLGIQLPEGDFDSILDIVNVKDLNAILQTISNLKVDETGLKYNYNGLIINLNILGGEFEKVVVAYKDILNININLNQEILVPEIDFSEYKNMLEENLFYLLNKQLIQNKNLSVKGEVTINGTSFEGLLRADFKNEDKVQFKVEIFNRTIVLTYINGNIYLEVDNILKAKGSVEEIGDFIKSLNIIDINIQNIDFNQILQELLNWLDNDTVALDLIKINGVVEAFEITETNVYCKIIPVEFEEITYEESGVYQNIVEIGNFAKTIIDAISNKPLAFDVVAQYKDYSVSGKLQYINNQLSAVLSTTIFEKEIVVEIENDLIYINLDSLKIKCSIQDIKEIVEFIQTNTNLDLDKITPKQDFDINELLDNATITMQESLMNIVIKDIILKLNAQTVGATFSYGDISGSITLGEQFELSSKQDYYDFTQLKDLFKATIKTLENKAISGEVDVTLRLFNEDNNLKIDYAVAYVENRFIATIFTNFKGLNVNVYVDNEDVYLDIVGLKIKFNINNIQEIINWANEKFNTNISLNVDELLSVEKLKDIHFDIIKNITAKQNQTVVEFTNGLFITVDYDTYVSRVKFSQDTREAQLTCTSFENINLDDLNREEYRNYTVFTELLDTTLNLVKTRQFDMSASVEKFVNNALTNTYNAKISIDLTGALNAFLDVTGLSQQITAHYENKVLYFCYGGANGMKIAIQENAIQEILGILFSALNIDTSSIPLLDEFLKKDGIDTGNLETIMPNIEMSNPLSYLEYIKSFDVTDSYFEITLKGEKLGEYAMGKDITIRVNFLDSKITNLEINNLYTSDVSNEFINVLVKLNDFNGVVKATGKEKYIDISGSKDLLRAFVNTSTMTDWHVTGKVKLDLKLGSLKINAAELEVDIKAKLDENKKPIVAVEITKYPLVGLVNNKNTNGVGAIGFAERYRSISVYYMNGELFLKTFDAKYGAYKELTRTTKITPQVMVENLSYYVQYLLGFTDSIQTKIDEAIAKSQSYTGETDFGNIIQEYTHSGNSHTAKINLAELVHNSDIGTLSLVIKTINNNSTKNLDYIYSLDMDLNLLDSMIILKSDSSNGSGGLFLTDIGSTVDISKCCEMQNTYIQNNFVLDGEYEKEGSKAWSKGNIGNGEITFISRGKEVKTITGEVASAISFPQMENFIVDDDVVLNEYQFVGWYYDEEFTNEFTLDTFPRYSTTLFAKWQVVLTKTHATINFEVGQANVTVSSIYGFIGESLSLPICENIVEKLDENTTLLKTFLGWFTEDGVAYNSEKLEQASLTLYAHWQEKQTTIYLLNIIYNGSEVYASNVENGTTFDLSILSCFNDSTLVYTSSDFNDSNIVSDFSVQNNTTWYLRNKFKVVVKSDITTLNGEAYYAEYELYEGSKLDLANYANFEKNNGTYTSEYTFDGYTLNGSKINEYSVITQNGDSTFVAVWTETQWCDITFDVSAWEKPSWWTIKSWVSQPYNVSTVSNTNDTNKVRIKRNSELVFSNYVATCKCDYKVSYKFKTVGWENSVSNIYDDSYSKKSMTITSNATLQPVWQHVY